VEILLSNKLFSDCRYMPYGGMVEVGTGYNLDGVPPCRIFGVSVSANLPLHHKVQKFSSDTGSPGWSWKKGHKKVVCACACAYMP